MKRLSWALIVFFAVGLVSACRTPAEIAKNKDKTKVCRKIRRTGSKLTRLECPGEPPLGLGVYNREGWRHTNRGGMISQQQARGNAESGPAPAVFQQ